MCALYGVGNPADSNCLIGPGGAYWAYYRAGPGATGWTYSRGGASGTTVTDGSVEGWRYGTGAAPAFVVVLRRGGVPAAGHRTAAGDWPLDRDPGREPAPALPRRYQRHCRGHERDQLQ